MICWHQTVTVQCSLRIHCISVALFGVLSCDSCDSWAELNGYGAAASEAGFNAGASPARRIRLFTPENGEDGGHREVVHGSPHRLDRPVAMKINRIE